MTKTKEPPEVVQDSFQHLIGVQEMYARSGMFKLKTIQIERSKRDELGFRVREGDGWGRADGVFISRITFGSVFDVCSLLSIGDEIVKIDELDMKAMNIGEALRYIFDCTKLSITLKIKTPLARKRAVKRKKIKEPPVSQQLDYKILNMKIGCPRKERHVYVEPEAIEEGQEPEE